MSGSRSTAEERRRAVIRSAVTVFARSGYTTSPVTKVAEHAGISSAYVMKLFPRKVDLFVAAIEDCYDRITEALEEAADQAGAAEPAETLGRMGARYAELIADRDLLLVQVQALAATQVPEIAAAVRTGYARITDLAMSRARATAEQAQEFIARGQLCHLLTAIDAFSTDETWAKTLTTGIRHTPTP
ncbi:TetR/AcrR family transcriptional regulator [Saccharopolyspora hirsuta]|uniref:TetR/AcrR family transcriptional regulator n=1 Tax=Saccharopolyspora hirsuta TaxID=1837 RepID=A0A5M7C373_SACHI|nr:TetR/AcrR family transcriptional regulator [Saccharopolyspora hirsuta]KAA5836213.1 TetR/AcrR family transcriptional regulator [Saccharopolyspora hirsuta]